jgi:hypothetical protein
VEPIVTSASAIAISADVTGKVSTNAGQSIVEAPNENGTIASYNKSARRGPAARAL